MKLSIIVPATSLLLLMGACNKPEADHPVSEVYAPQPEPPPPSSEEPVVPPPEEVPLPDSEEMAPADTETTSSIADEKAVPEPAETLEPPGEVTPDTQDPPED